MTEYTYEGMDRAGKRVNGKIDVPSEGDLRMALRSQGIRPLKIGKVGTLNTDLSKILKGGIRNIPTEALVGFTRQLNLLISSGVPLLQGLEILIEQTSHGTLKSILSIVKERVSQGAYLWETLATYPQVFPKLYVSLIRAGESSGSLDQMLKRLTTYLETADKAKKVIKSAMMYPIIVSGIGIGVVSLMLIFVIPKFEELLKSGGQELPELTQMIIDLSHFLTNNILYLIAGIGTASYLGVRYFRSAEGLALRDQILFRMPLFGTMMQKAGVARFCRTLQTLLMSGVNLMDAIDICKATIDNAVLEASVAKIRAEIEAGKTLGQVMKSIGIFPQMAVQMIIVGESTGNMDKMLEKVADYYEQEVEVLVGGLTKLIEPLVLVFLGGAVGGMMIAMYLPIFKLAGGAGN